MRQLLAAGADASAQDNLGGCALLEAVKAGRDPIIQVRWGLGTPSLKGGEGGLGPHRRWGGVEPQRPGAPANRSCGCIHQHLYLALSASLMTDSCLLCVCPACRSSLPQARG